MRYLLLAVLVIGCRSTSTDNSLSTLGVHAENYAAVLRLKDGDRVEAEFCIGRRAPTDCAQPLKVDGAFDALLKEAHAFVKNRLDNETFKRSPHADRVELLKSALTDESVERLRNNLEDNEKWLVPNDALLGEDYLAQLFAGTLVLKVSNLGDAPLKLTSYLFDARLAKQGKEVLFHNVSNYSVSNTKESWVAFFSEGKILHSEMQQFAQRNRQQVDAYQDTPRGNMPMILWLYQQETGKDVCALIVNYPVFKTIFENGFAKPVSTNSKLRMSPQGGYFVFGYPNLSMRGDAHWGFQFLISIRGLSAMTGSSAAPVEALDAWLSCSVGDANWSRNDLLKVFGGHFALKN
jgi:hypothetical protein